MENTNPNMSFGGDLKKFPVQSSITSRVLEQSANDIKEKIAKEEIRRDSLKDKIIKLQEQKEELLKLQESTHLEQISRLKKIIEQKTTTLEQAKKELETTTLAVVETKKYNGNTDIDRELIKQIKEIKKLKSEIDNIEGNCVEFNNKQKDSHNRLQIRLNEVQQLTQQRNELAHVLNDLLEQSRSNTLHAAKTATQMAYPLEELYQKLNGIHEKKENISNCIDSMWDGLPPNQYIEQSNMRLRKRVRECIEM